MATHVNDLGVRQHEMDETDVAEIVRHFVDEEWLSLTVSARVADVTLAEPAEFGRHKFRESARITIVFTSPHFNHDALDVGEFVRPFHERVRGENLFDQRGSRARQADNENRIRVWHADTRPLREKLCRAHLNLLTYTGFGDVSIVTACGALQCVAALVESP